MNSGMTEVMTGKRLDDEQQQRVARDGLAAAPGQHVAGGGGDDDRDHDGRQGDAEAVAAATVATSVLAKTLLKFSRVRTVGAGAGVPGSERQQHGGDDRDQHDDAMMHHDGGEPPPLASGARVRAGARPQLGGSVMTAARRPVRWWLMLISAFRIWR